MILVITLTPILYNFRDVFAIGIYNKEDDYINSYSDGTAGINLHLHLERVDGSRYTINTFIESISTGNVVNYGLLSVDILYLNNDDYAFARLVQFGAPSSTYPVSSFYIELAKNDNLTCYGTIEISLETGGVPINDTINFQLTFIVPTGMGDYQNIDMMINLFFPLHFLLYIIVPVILIWIFKPLLGLRYNEEDLKRDKKFWNFILNKGEEERKEPITDKKTKT